MARIISVHSSRGGTGKSNMTACLGALMAQRGLRVGLVDADILSPGLHILCGLAEADAPFNLNDYLWGRCRLEQTVCDVTAAAGEVPGKLYLIPSSTDPSELAAIWQESFDVTGLEEGCEQFVEQFSLDMLLIDTHPGLNEETLLALAFSDAALILLRADIQDYQGTAVTLDLARRFDVNRQWLLVNKMSDLFLPEEVQAMVADSYHCEVCAVLPHSEDMMVLGSAGIFATHYPHHPITNKLQSVVAQLLSEKE